MIKRFAIICLSILTVFLMVIAAFVTMSKDNTPPVIKFGADMVYVAGEDTSVLLEGVTATDSKDGDVSDSIIIERMLPLENGTQIVVHYAAKDKSNNLSKAQRTVNYVPLESTDEPEQTARFYRVMLINNLGIPNLATEWSFEIEADGHTVTSLGASTDPVIDQTVIYVENEGEGTELLKFFPTARIEVGSAADRVNSPVNGATVFVVFGLADSAMPD